MEVFYYLCILLFIIVFIIYLLIEVIKKCPKKIKGYYGIILFILLSRNITLLLLALVEKQKIIYLCKNMAMLNIITIPLVALGALYIFIRGENKNFDYNYLFLFAAIGTYILLVYIFRIQMSIDNDFGYIVYFKENLIPSLLYLIMMGSITIVSLINCDKPYSNRSGMKFLTFASMIIVFEYILFLGGMKVFPYPLLGEVIMLLCLFKSIRTFKVIEKNIKI